VTDMANTEHVGNTQQDAISWFAVSPEALVRCGGNIKYVLTAHVLANIYAKNCRNRTVYVKL